VAAEQISCDLDEAYITDNPLELKGSLNFWVEVTTTVEEQTEVTYDFGDVEAATTVTPGAGDCEEKCTFTGRSNYKWGTYDAESETAVWGVSVKAPGEGMAGGEQVTVTDHPGPGLAITRTYLVRSNTVGMGKEGK